MTRGCRGEPATPGGESGADVLWEEITDQPDALIRQLQAREEVAAIARVLRDRRCDVVRFVAHGSSDNAATYGVYALGLLTRISAMRDSVSLPVYYRTPLRLQGTAVVAVSQSGHTPDVIEYVRAARSVGATTVAITNDPGSPLAEHAELVLTLRCGPERSLAATKTYTASLAALALLAGALGDQLGAVTGGLARVATAMPATIAANSRDANAVAALLNNYDRILVTGRGVHYATAREMALKLIEIAHLFACAHSATELLHGPIAMLERPCPVWAIGGQDAADVAVRATLDRAHQAAAPTILTGPIGACLKADYVMAAAPAPSPLLAPLLATLSGQIVAHAAARLRGRDPNEPSRLMTKTTLAP